MKHVFVINSHTTFLTSMGVIEYLQIPTDDVIFIYKRNYKNNVTPVPYKIIDATELAKASKDITAQYQKYILKVDEFIEENIPGKYCLYVPHMWHYFFQILYTNKRCKRVSYVQEGGPAQTEVYENDVPVIEVIKSFIRHAIMGKRTFECKWYKKGTIFKQWRLDSYAINDVYFHKLPSKNHIVNWPTTHLDICIDSERPIFIFDGFITNGYVEPNVYLSCCKEIITKYAKQKNYVKFHPAQKTEERNTILFYFSEIGTNAETMRDDIPTEYVIMQFKNLTFVGFMSSLLYYAHDFGHKVICCEKLIISSSASYKQHLKDTGFMTFEKTYSHNN